MLRRVINDLFKIYRFDVKKIKIKIDQNFFKLFVRVYKIIQNYQSNNNNKFNVDIVCRNFSVNHKSFLYHIQSFLRQHAFCKPF